MLSLDLEPNQKFRIVMNSTTVSVSFHDDHDH